MQRTYRVPFARVWLGGLAAALGLLVHPGTSIPGGGADPPRPGPVDGLFGPRTQAALVRFQHQSKVPANGVVTERTGRLLASAGGQPAKTERVKTPQAKSRQRRAAAPAPRGERRRLAASLG